MRCGLKLSKTKIMILWLILYVILFGSSRLCITYTTANKANSVIPSYGGTLIEGSKGNITAVNPVLSSYAGYDTPNGKIERLLYEPLIAFDSKNQILPHLAQAWETSLDKKTYTFQLRKDVYWHDGEQFTANDVIFTWDRLLDPATQHQSYTTADYHIELLDTSQVPYEKVNNFTVRFFLDRTTSGADFLSRCVFPILPQHGYTNYLGADGLPHTVDDCRSADGTYTFNTDPRNTRANNTLPIGTGPLMFGSWNPNENLTLIRNSRKNGGPGYWQEHNAYLDQYILDIIGYGLDPYNLLTSGRIDLFRDEAPRYNPEKDYVRTLQTNKSFRALKIPQFRYEFLGFQCDPSRGNLYGESQRNFHEHPNHLAGFAWQLQQHPELSITGHLVRPALNYAVNKTQVMAATYPFGYRQLGPVFKAHPRWYVTDLPAYSFDLKKANELLEQAGFGGTPIDSRRRRLNITLTGFSSISKSLIANVTAQLQQNLGIPVVSEHIQYTESYTYLEERVFDGFAFSKINYNPSQTPNILEDWHSKYIQPGGQPTGISSTGAWEWSWSDPSPEPYGPNIVSYWNPAVDHLLDLAQSESNHQVLRDYYSDIQRLIVQDSPAIFLFSRSQLGVVNVSFHGWVEDSPQGLWPEPVGFHNIYLHTKSAGTMVAPPPSFPSLAELTVIFMGLSSLGLLGYLLYVINSRSWERKHPVKTL